jgi:hypothetical protein
MYWSCRITISMYPYRPIRIRYRCNLASKYTQFLGMSPVPVAAARPGSDFWNSMNLHAWEFQKFFLVPLLFLTNTQSYQSILSSSSPALHPSIPYPHSIQSPLSLPPVGPFFFAYTDGGSFSILHETQPTVKKVTSAQATIAARRHRLLLSTTWRVLRWRFGVSLKTSSFFRMIPFR